MVIEVFFQRKVLASLCIRTDLARRGEVWLISIVSWICTPYNWQRHAYSGTPTPTPPPPRHLQLTCGCMYVLLAVERVKTGLEAGGWLLPLPCVWGPERLWELPQLLWWEKSTFDRNREIRKCGLLFRKIISSFLYILSLKWEFDLQVEMSGAEPRLLSAKRAQAACVLDRILSLTGILLLVKPCNF